MHTYSAARAIFKTVLSARSFCFALLQFGSCLGTSSEEKRDNCEEDEGWCRLGFVRLAAKGAYDKISMTVRVSYFMLKISLLKIFIFMIRIS